MDERHDDHHYGPGPKRESASKSGKARSWLNWVLEAAIDGVGPLDDAQRFAARCLATADSDAEQAIKQLTTSEMRALGLSGFVTGLPGLTTAAVAIPADMTWFMVRATRLAAAVAHLRGHDLSSPAVRSLVGLTLAGDQGIHIAKRHGVELGSFESVDQLEELPRKMRDEIDQTVAVRLLSSLGLKSTIRLSRFIPIVGGIAGGTVNMVALREVAVAANKNFPATPA